MLITQSTPADGQHPAQGGVRGHDRPLGGPQVQQIRKEVAGQYAVAPASPRAGRPGVDYHARPSAVAAICRPVIVRSGCTDSISLVSGTTRLASPPVAITSGRAFLAGHSATMRRPVPSPAA